MNKSGQVGRRRHRGILSHAEDLHCILFHLLVLTAYATAFWIYAHPETAGIATPAELAVFTLASAFLLGWISGIDVGVNFHHHVHRPIFRHEVMNRWFGRLWTFSGGWPAFFWHHAHWTVHHCNVLESRDWTLPHRRRNGDWESLLRYSLMSWPWRYGKSLWHDFTSAGTSPALARQARREFAWFLLLWSIPFWIDPLMALGLWVLPHWFANAYVMGPGMYAQHYGCTPSTPQRPYTHSNTFTSKFFNLTMLNIGYHIEHHHFPAVHWSALPRLHDKLSARIVAGGAHIVPFGYYRGGQLLSAMFFRTRGRKLFMAQHEAYRRNDTQYAMPDVTAAGLPESAR